MVGVVEPLGNAYPVVKADGTPTEYFIRWAQQKQLDIEAGIDETILEAYLSAHPLQAGAGIALSPSGNLADSPTISAEVQAILDQLSTTQGAVLYRGASDWAALGPGTAGQFLQTAGAGANPAWATPASGADPWTYLKLAADYTTSLTTWATVTGMSFTPAANTDYEVEWCLNCQTVAINVGARPGIAWGTGYQYGGISLFTPSSGTAQTLVNGSINNAAGTAQAAVGGLPIANRTYAHYGQATFRSGTTPTAFQLRLASELAANAVTAKAGSFLKYRTI